MAWIWIEQFLPMHCVSILKHSILGNQVLFLINSFVGTSLIKGCDLA